jgi:hypothetical protein
LPAIRFMTRAGFAGETAMPAFFMGLRAITLCSGNAGAAMKIPVGKTLEAAFNFGFKNFFSILGIVWFPFLVGIALIVGAIVLSLAGLQGVNLDPKMNPAGFVHAMIHLSGAFVVAWVVFLVAGAMIQVGLLRKALGLHPGPVFIYFSLGPDVWRMLGAMLLLFVIMMGIVIGLTLAGLAAYGIAHVAMGEPGSYWIAGLAGVVLFCAYIYSVVRISYFVPVVVVAERHIGIGRAWALARGNFWRIVAVVLVISLAVNIVASMLTSIVAPSFMMTFNSQSDPTEFLHHYMTYLSSYGPLLGIVYLLQTVLLYGLLAGASANAYRALTEPAPIAAPPPQGMQTA